MDAQEFAMHMNAGKHYGQASACGTKIRHGSESEAERHALALNRHPSRKGGENPQEHYPCYWCNHWHVGREMTEEERSRFRRGEEETGR